MKRYEIRYQGIPYGRVLTAIELELEKPIDPSIVVTKLNMAELYLKAIKRDQISTEDTRRVASQLEKMVAHYRSQHLVQTQ